MGQARALASSYSNPGPSFATISVGLANNQIWSGSANKTRRIVTPHIGQTATRYAVFVVALWIHASHNSLPTATGVTTAVLGYVNMPPAKLLVVVSMAALQQWR